MEWVYITSTVPWINEQNGRVVPPLALPDVDWEKPGGRPGQRLPLWRAHAVVAVSRGGEDTQGEGGYPSLFFVR
jgi:hypothetical protein